MYFRVYIWYGKCSYSVVLIEPNKSWRWARNTITVRGKTFATFNKMFKNETIKNISGRLCQNIFVCTQIKTIRVRKVKGQKAIVYRINIIMQRLLKKLKCTKKKKKKNSPTTKSPALFAVLFTRAGLAWGAHRGFQDVPARSGRIWWIHDIFPLFSFSFFLRHISPYVCVHFFSTECLQLKPLPIENKETKTRVRVKVSKKQDLFLTDFKFAANLDV